MGVDSLASKTKLFLHSHSDHNNAIAPIRIWTLSLRSIPCSQLPKILATEWWMQGWGYLDDWPYRTCKLTIEEQMFYGFKQHFKLPCQLCFARLSFVKTTPRRRYQAKTLIFNIYLLISIILPLSNRWKVKYFKFYQPDESLDNFFLSNGLLRIGE